jgi:hypothetical protein
MVFVAECLALITIPDIKWKYFLQFPFSVLYLDLKLCKNLEFHLSECCKCGIKSWGELNLRPLNGCRVDNHYIILHTQLFFYTEMPIALLTH